MHRVKMAELVFIFMSVLLVNGCGTIQTVSSIKEHSGNVEIRVRAEQSIIEWKSAPDFTGQILIDAMKACDQPRLFVGAGFFNKEIKQVEKTFWVLDLTHGIR